MVQRGARPGGLWQARTTERSCLGVQGHGVWPPHRMRRGVGQAEGSRRSRLCSFILSSASRKKAPKAGDTYGAARGGGRGGGRAA